MVMVLRLAKAVVDPLVHLLLNDRRRRAERSLPLAELINVSLLDDYQRRSFQREIEAIRDEVAQRLEASSGHEWRDLDDGDREAVLNAVVDTFESADLSDTAFLAADADPIRLARDLKQSVPALPTQAGLGTTAIAYYNRLLGECCTIYAQLVVHLSSFGPRAATEALGRISSLRASVEQVLQRLPLRTLDAPTGSDHDDEFLDRYLHHLSATLDTVELFGLDVRGYRPATTLSVAYISLTVSLESSRSVRPGSSRWARGELFAEVREDEAGVRVEYVLGTSNRILLRGEAGSGKSTLLNWLAVTAARGAFKADLNDWNRLTPFVIKLREYAGRSLPAPERWLEGVANPIAGLMPVGWIHRQLEAGRALLLIDGVDELSVDDRRAVRNWIRQLLHAYPDNHIVVTSRPHAAVSRWLEPEDFESAVLDRMRAADVRSLIAHWHAAMRYTGGLPCQPEELPAYERALVAQLDSSAHLQNLATSPLLCAMLCALNLDRHQALPLDRMGIYAAALDMLLERRDVERRVPSYTGLGLNARRKIELLQYLAWRLSVNGRTQMSRVDVVRRLSERLATIPLQDATPEGILDHLLHRSGVIQEPVIDRIDFVHRTFQEYLTAREAAEQGDVGLLVDHAHLDTWRETIIMAAGHGNRPTRHELLTGLLNRADVEPRNSRALWLLAAACLETVGPIDSELRSQIEAKLCELVPPRRLEEARSLASAGPVLVRCAPRDLSDYSVQASRSMVACIGLLGGSEALQLLSHYASDHRTPVQRQLFDTGRYFDPHEYADQVLSHMQNYVENALISDLEELQYVRHLPGLKKLSHVQLELVTDLSAVLAGLPPISRLWLSGAIEAIEGLVEHSASLKDLTLWSGASIGDLTQLTRLRNLEHLAIGHSGRLNNLDHLEGLSALKELWLVDCDDIRDFTPLTELPHLELLRFDRFVPDSAWAVIPRLRSLTALEFVGQGHLPGGLLGIATAQPNLSRLVLLNLDWLESVDGIANLECLESLMIEGGNIREIGELSRLSKLKTLQLYCPLVTDLAPLAEIPTLRDLFIDRGMAQVDLSSLRDCTMTIHLWRESEVRRWRPKMGKGIKFASLGRRWR